MVGYAYPGQELRNAAWPHCRAPRAARATATRATELEPPASMWWVSVGYVNLGGGDERQARGAVEQALSKPPVSRHAHELAVRLHLR